MIHYNSAAIKLYTKNQFQFLRNIPDFYYFNETYFPAYLFAFYVNNHHAPGTSSGAESFFGAVRFVASSVRLPCRSPVTLTAVPV